jgi:hypothetical protein
MPKPLKRFLNLLCSLRLTIVLLVLGLILVFLGTMAQEPLGLYIAQTHFFHSMFVDAAAMLAALKKSAQLVNIYLTPMLAADVLAAPWIPVFPGGYLIGTLLLINLVAAHIQRFRMSWKKSGIFLVHLGLILLLLGQLMTDQLATESGIRIREGETRNYSEADRRSEFALIDTTEKEKDKVFAVPESLLKQRGAIQPPGLPFHLNIKEYFEHSTVTNRSGAILNQPAQATQGIGVRAHAIELPRVTSMEYRDVPSMVVEVAGPEGSLGTWMVSGYFDEPQKFTYKDRTYAMTLRLARHYYPFSLSLLDFRHDKYKGTELPRNFSSQIRLQNPSTGEDREVLIYMNNPLRYAGLTFYQASFDKVDDKVTVLQVVRNPGWLTPYIACIMAGLGLVIQFMIHLVGFIKKRTS